MARGRIAAGGGVAHSASPTANSVGRTKPKMRQAQARKPYNAYLDAPKRSEHPHLRVVEDLRVEAPAVEIPDWAEPFADPRWDDRLGWPEYEERDGRRTVLVTGRPEGKSVPRRDIRPGATARMRRQAPTRARLAGRPDRV